MHLTARRVRLTCPAVPGGITHAAGSIALRHSGSNITSAVPGRIARAARLFRCIPEAVRRSAGGVPGGITLASAQHRAASAAGPTSRRLAPAGIAPPQGTFPLASHTSSDVSSVVLGRRHRAAWCRSYAVATPVGKQRARLRAWQREFVLHLLKPLGAKEAAACRHRADLGVLCGPQASQDPRFVSYKSRLASAMNRRKCCKKA